MKATAWRDYLEGQNRLHEKTLFSITELASVAGTSRSALNVELNRMRRQGVIVRYAHGRYGLPGAVTPQVLLAGIDSHAYITGIYSLHFHNTVTQSPFRITCFTDKRSPRARERRTPVGRFFFVCVRSAVYAPPETGVIVSPEQALCDYLYLLRKDGVRVEGQVTFRNLDKLRRPEIENILARYPSTVAGEVRRILD